MLRTATPSRTTSRHKTPRAQAAFGASSDARAARIPLTQRQRQARRLYGEQKERDAKMPRQQKGKRGQSPPAATTNFANQKAASQAATNSLNSLRRVDPSIVEILASATHATLYNFGADQEWERADVEGPLFIAARNAHPRVRLVVLNRLSMTNMVEDVDETFELEVVDRYLIFRRSDDETRIRGLWFHSLEEHARMGEILERLVDEASQPPPPPPPAAPAVAASLMGALSVNEPAAPLLSPSLFAPPAPAPVVQKPAAPSLDLATFKDVLRELVEDDAFIQELHYRYQDKLQSA